MPKYNTPTSQSDYDFSSPIGFDYATEMAAIEVERDAAFKLTKTLVANKQQEDKLAAENIYGKALGNMYEGDRVLVEQMRDYIHSQYESGSYNQNPVEFQKSVAQLNEMTKQFGNFYTQSYGTDAATGAGNTYADILYNEKTGNDPYSKKGVRPIGDAFESAQGTLQYMQSGGYDSDSVYITEEGIMMARVMDPEGNIGEYHPVNELPHRMLGNQAFIVNTEEVKPMTLMEFSETEGVLSSLKLAKGRVKDGKGWDIEVYNENKYNEWIMRGGPKGEEFRSILINDPNIGGQLDLTEEERQMFVQGGEVGDMLDDFGNVIEVGREAWKDYLRYGADVFAPGGKGKKKATEDGVGMSIDHTISANMFDTVAEASEVDPQNITAFDLNVQGMTITPFTIDSVDHGSYEVKAISSDHLGNKYVGIPKSGNSIFGPDGNIIENPTADQWALAGQKLDGYEIKEVEDTEWIQITGDGATDSRAGEISRNISPDFMTDFDSLREKAYSDFERDAQVISEAAMQNRMTADALKEPEVESDIPDPVREEEQADASEIAPAYKFVEGEAVPEYTFNTTPLEEGDEGYIPWGEPGHGYNRHGGYDAWYNKSGGAPGFPVPNRLKSWRKAKADEKAWEESFGVEEEPAKSIFEYPTTHLMRDQAKESFKKANPDLTEEEIDKIIHSQAFKEHLEQADFSPSAGGTGIHSIEKVKEFFGAGELPEKRQKMDELAASFDLAKVGMGSGPIETEEEVKARLLIEEKELKTKVEDNIMVLVEGVGGIALEEGYKVDLPINVPDSANSGVTIAGLDIGPGAGDATEKLDILSNFLPPEDMEELKKLTTLTGPEASKALKEVQDRGLLTKESMGLTQKDLNRITGLQASKVHQTLMGKIDNQEEAFESLPDSVRKVVLGVEFMTPGKTDKPEQYLLPALSEALKTNSPEAWQEVADRYRVYYGSGDKLKAKLDSGRVKKGNVDRTNRAGDEIEAYIKTL